MAVDKKDAKAKVVTDGGILLAYTLTDGDAEDRARRANVEAAKLGLKVRYSAIVL